MSLAQLIRTIHKIYTVRDLNPDHIKEKEKRREKRGKNKNVD